MRKQLLKLVLSLFLAFGCISPVFIFADESSDADVVESLIQEIDVNSDDCKAKIDQAQSAYDALSDEEKSQVESREYLTEAKYFLMYLTTKDYFLNGVKPENNYIDGEWKLLGMQRSDSYSQEWADHYYQSLCNVLNEKDGILSSTRNSEYSRAIIGLSSIGKDARDVDGYDLIKPLYDVKKTCEQGVNGAAYALLALDSMNYAKDNQDVRNQYIDFILSSEISGGGFSYMDNFDVDLTSIVLEALAPNQDDSKVKVVVDRCVDLLSKAQYPNGGFEAWGDVNCESTSQAIVAITSLGMDIDDERFVKNGSNMIDALYRFYVEGGGFKHVESGELDPFATEQAFYALVAYQRWVRGETPLYKMGDTADFEDKLPNEEVDEPIKDPIDDEKMDGSEKPVDEVKDETNKGIGNTPQTGVESYFLLYLSLFIASIAVALRLKKG